MLSYAEPAVTVEEAAVYLTAAGEAWTGSEETKAAAIIRGQRFIAGAYNGRWATEWDNDDAPEGVKFAIIEAARRELAKPGSLTPDITKSGQASRKRVKAGPVETETQFAEMKSASDGLPVIVAIDRLLAGLLRSASGNSIRLVRA